MPEPRPHSEHLLRAGAVAALTALAVLILGYHPFAEDGGIYFTALVQRLHPELFPHAHAFATAHLGHSVYLTLLAAVAGLAPRHVEWLLLLVHIASIAFTLLAVLEISKSLHSSRGGHLITVALVAVASSLPVAGTALYIFDPYVTARAVSTPLLLFALVLVLRRRLLLAALVALATIALHPLMGVWGSVFLLAVWCAEIRRSHRALLLCACSVFVACGLIQIFAPVEYGVTYTLAHSRAYWYVARWEWFEWIGLVAPPMLLWTMYLRPGVVHHGLARRLAVGVIFVFALATLIALTFVHPANHRLMLARMQPMRMLQFAYVAFFILLAERLAAICKSTKRRCALAMTLALASVCLWMVQRNTYAASHHFELPSRPPASPWAQAFVWIRKKTPVDAVIAMDAHYISAPEEDAQNARAITERSTLADYSKDGGAASVSTHLAADWERAERAQEGLETATDEQRHTRLAPFGVSFLVLRVGSATALECPYRNEAVKVCRLPEHTFEQPGF